MPLDPDWQRFVQLEDAGLFRVWAGRTETGLLVAYLAFFVQPHLHYKSTLTAVEDLFMLSAPYRRGMSGVRLFTTALEALRALGVIRVILHDKTHFSAERAGGGLEILFNRLGFCQTDRIWSKIL